MRLFGKSARVEKEGSSGFPVKRYSPQRRRVHRGFVAILKPFSLRLGGAISEPFFTQKPEEPKRISKSVFTSLDNLAAQTGEPVSEP